MSWLILPHVTGLVAYKVTKNSDKNQIFYQIFFAYIYFRNVVYRFKFRVSIEVSHLFHQKNDSCSFERFAFGIIPKKGLRTFLPHIYQKSSGMPLYKGIEAWEVTTRNLPSTSRFSLPTILRSIRAWVFWVAPRREVGGRYDGRLEELQVFDSEAVTSEMGVYEVKMRKNYFFEDGN